MGKIFTIAEGLENMGALRSGGQGSVYRGRRMGEIITAIKILPTPIHSETTADKNYLQFQNEVQKLRKVNEHHNPHVATILNSGITESGNFPYIEMEFIEGPDLADLLQPPHPPVFTVKETLKVAMQLSDALAHCHQVGVRHGDIKSNNVKYNKRTGNYVLLDFGLAIMSDEQRRTSMRHAGAIEFMAPEQNEGVMLFETDVYSFGVILFELLAGSVPFPLKDNGETSRNVVRMAQMETPPPDLLQLRKAALPKDWSDEKRCEAMEVPQWLVNMIYRCLEKQPAKRFPNGMELHAHMVRNSILGDNKSEWLERVQILQQENERLLRENERYRKQLQSAPVTAGSVTTPVQNVQTSAAAVAPPPDSRKKGITIGAVLLALLVVIVIGGLVYVLLSDAGVNKQKPAIADNSPQTPAPDPELVDDESSVQLTEARVYLASNKMSQALTIYKRLAEKKVPEGMYMYSTLALKNRNPELTCRQAFDLLLETASKGYAPAKRTAGFLFTYANDPETLRQSNYYDRCNLARNPVRGSRLLMEAMIQGDTIAARLVDDLNRKRPR
ncbi:serine/threonine protein kinase [Segetibacter sp. 3557_3]|uniref:serine/threonine protein kinase n=1 Tax=Segetibacter sp. 3557_3 TaxID=2547429 RepID=UPI0010591154|nr:protein kinase [Segetibacter sp. 3557_3]TDH26565.1 serine/threonine protein kinase [Segetibacter sp. 3557_3]